MDEEETALESYETPLDKDDCPVDEYQVFKSVLESKQVASLLVLQGSHASLKVLEFFSPEIQGLEST